MSGLAKRTMVCAMLSIVLLAPCVWQPRIEAGDLGSHVYNAWLAQLIERGQAPGLRLAQQSNNILFDLLLGGLMRAYGALAAQRIAVSLAVLIFFWGAFAFVWSRSARAPWALVPCLAVLAYGWVFRMGLFNFYISMGLCLAALALARPKSRWMWAALPLLAVAYVAHALPVAWAVAFLVYERVAEAMAPRRRQQLMMGALGALAVTALLLKICFETRRSTDQLLAVTGADQLWIYGKDYAALAVAMFVVWGLCLWRLIVWRGLPRTLLDVRVQICLLSVAALVLLPGGVLLPGYRTGLDYLTERMSLAVAILFCAVVARVRLPKPLVGAMAAITVVSFALSYRDDRALNQVEARVEQAVAQLPPGQRVVNALEAAESRIRPMTHLIDRACVGRCFSYANYEPCTGQFRVRAERQNPFVVWNYGDSWDIQMGGYVVQPRDLPLYKIDLCDPAKGEVCAAALEAGDRVSKTGLRIAKVRTEEGDRHE